MMTLILKLGTHYPCSRPVTYHVTYHVRPHQPVIDQQGIGLRGLVHKEAHPVLYKLNMILGSL